MTLTGSSLRDRREKLGLSQAKFSELTAIPQHLLSAFELGKADLPPILSSMAQRALANTDKIAMLARRSKRYRRHAYGSVLHDAARIARHHRTVGNFEYCRLLDDLAAAHVAPRVEKLSALSLFSGAGGLSLGFSAAGFSIKGFLEIDANLRRIYSDNFPGSTSIGTDITHISECDLQRLASTMSPVDIIIGGPPCQGFSLSGKRRVDDPRNTLFRHYLRFVQEVRPKIVLLENVRLLTSMKDAQGRLVKDEICASFLGLDYRVRCFEVNAKHYGVPQHRERAIFVAVRSDIDISPSIPDGTHGIEQNLFSRQAPVRSFADACSDLAFLESGEECSDALHCAVRHPKHVIEWLWDVPEGRSAHDNEDPALRPLSGYNTTYKRQVWGEPASTVQTTFGMISGCRNVHPIATRSLTIREAARIQSFPDTYCFRGVLGSIRGGIGNAVPPLMAHAFAMHFKSQLLRSDRNSQPPD